MQALVFEEYPVLLIIMFFINLFLAVLAGLLSLVAVRDPRSWALKVDSGLVAVLYLAVVGNAFRVTMTSWCVKRRGPVYVAMFKPLGILCAVVLGIVFLGDQLYRGRYLIIALVLSFIMLIFDNHAIPLFGAHHSIHKKKSITDFLYS